MDRKKLPGQKSIDFSTSGGQDTQCRPCRIQLCTCGRLDGDANTDDFLIKLNDVSASVERRLPETLTVLAVIDVVFLYNSNQFVS